MSICLKMKFTLIDNNYSIYEYQCSIKWVSSFNEFKVFRNQSERRTECCWHLQLLKWEKLNVFNQKQTKIVNCWSLHRRTHINQNLNLIFISSIFFSNYRNKISLTLLNTNDNMSKIKVHFISYCLRLFQQPFIYMKQSSIKRTYTISFP